MRRKKLKANIQLLLFDDAAMNVKQTHNKTISMKHKNDPLDVIEWIIDDVITSPFHAAAIIGAIRVLTGTDRSGTDRYNAVVEVMDSHIRVQIPIYDDIKQHQNSKTIDAIVRAFLRYNSDTFARTPTLEDIESRIEEWERKKQQETQSNKLGNEKQEKQKRKPVRCLGQYHYHKNLSIDDRLSREVKMFLEAIMSKCKPVTEGEYHEDDLYTCDLCGYVYNNFRAMVEARGSDNKSKSKKPKTEFSDMIKRASMMPSYGQIFYTSTGSFSNSVYGIDAENSNKYLCPLCGFLMLCIPAAFTKIVLEGSEKSDYIFIYSGSLIQTYRMNEFLSKYAGDWIESLRLQRDAAYEYMTIFRKNTNEDMFHTHLIDRTQLQKLNALCKEEWFKKELLRERDLLEICLSGETYRLIDKALDMAWDDISTFKGITNFSVCKMLKMHDFVLSKLLDDDRVNNRHSYQKYVEFGRNVLRRKDSIYSAVKNKVFTLLRHIRKCNTVDFLISMLDIILRSTGKVDNTFGLFCQEFIDCSHDTTKAEIFQRSALAILYGLLLQEDKISAEVAEKSVPSKKLK